MTNQKERIIHWDLLRILAAFSIVMLHAAAQFWYDLDKQSTEWLIANSYDALFRFGVPIFVMISGVLFLNPNYVLSIKRLYKHNLFRIISIYIIWSSIYGLYDSLSFDFNAVGPKEILREMIFGRYHLWFLPMIAGIYALLPILKSWIANTEKRYIEYFLILFFILQICKETLCALTKTDEIHYILNLGTVDMVSGYIGYFVWGYYIAYVGINTKLRKLFYILFIPSILLNVILGNIYTRNIDLYGAIIYDSFGIFTFIIVTVLFLFTHEYISRIQFSPKSCSLIKEVSADTFGIYVMHIGFIEITAKTGFHSMTFPNIIGIPLLACVTFIACMILSAIIRRIPIIGKFIC